ncbi:MAG: hypothetical protein IJ745_04390 [Bacteroidales bacterium]|nr:hypothetical protein [Bacteroidales bacterium]
MAKLSKRLILTFLALWSLTATCGAQKLIEYTSGMGSRNPDNSDIWILYRGVTARHEGMTLKADSAHYNTHENRFTAFGGVTITISDTTFILGDHLFYDGNTRVADIWDDTVVLVDGSTRLLANHITYERNRATAYYTLWGHATSADRTLDSRQGEYNSDLKEFYIYGNVILADSSMRLLTDTLIYNTTTEVAHFESPTHIYTDSTHIYSELGDYNTATRFAASFRRSSVDNQGRTIDSDTLFYDEGKSYGKARGNVKIFDPENDITCTGLYGESNRQSNFSFVTKQALVTFVDKGDTLFLHADTVYVVTDDSNHLQSVRASHKVKVYRRDAQAMCDSAYYSAPDSTLRLFQNPVLWYDHYQCTADTIELLHDTSGVRHAWLRSSCFALQQVDREKFNQLKGRQGEVFFADGEPLYADIKGNAEMVYYITEDDSTGTRLVGANVGMGSDIRIYFDTTRAPSRVVTYDKPDLKTYPVMQLPAEWHRLKDFRWLATRRPRKPQDVFVW